MENQNSEKKMKYLYRSRTNRVISGVCGGMSDYLGLDATLIRILFVLLAFINGIGILLYLLALIIIPKNPHSEESGAKVQADTSNTSILIGAILIIAGIYFLLVNYAPFWFPFDFYWHWVFDWRLFWPIMLIVLGVFYIWYVASKPEKTTKESSLKRDDSRQQEPTASTQTGSNKRLYRSLTNKKISGVCGGLGEYFGVDPTWIRLGWLLVSLFHPPAGILVYIILVIVVPYEEQSTGITK